MRQRAVHPRVRGEHVPVRRHRTTVKRFIPACAGNTTARSSPFVRFIPACAGNTCRPYVAAAWRRFIPACAGNTVDAAPSHSAVRRFIPACAGNTASAAAASAPARRFIPACAGNTRSALPRVGLDGSSPRARGTRDCHRRHTADGRRRFIPACAGNTLAPADRRVLHRGSSPRARGTHLSHPRRRSSDEAVHPRVRGEHVWMACRTPPGSVHPRVRGEHASPLMPCSIASRRFIPACAGNTTTWGGAAIARSGSSPRARGTRCRCGAPRLIHRFIPACAGNTSAARRSRVSAPVHPRVRGEHHSTVLRALRSRRFIPACAGNTASSPHPSGSCPVHPRVRGEHTGTLCAASRTIRCTGSSPRARGTPFLQAFLLQP